MKNQLKYWIIIIFFPLQVFHVKAQKWKSYPFSLKGNTDQPALFAEGVISTPDDEFGGTFSKDGRMVYFSKSVPGSYLYTICYSEFEKGHWTTPKIMPFSGRYRDFAPVLSPDGNTMVFASDRPVKNEIKNDYDIWMVKRNSRGWGEPFHLPAPVNTRDDEHFASLAANGNIYFSSTRPDANGNPLGSDVYRCRLVEGIYQPAEHLDSVSTDAFELDVIITPDEHYLFAGAYGRPDGFGGFDIFVSRNTNGVWGKAKNLGPVINTPYRDYSPRISPDGRYLFFTSERDFTQKADIGHRYQYQELMGKFHSIMNGLGNIYQIDLKVVLDGVEW